MTRTAIEPVTAADHPEFETFDLGASTRVLRGQYAFLINLPDGAHVHFRDVKAALLRTAIRNLNLRQQKREPAFYLSVRAVSDSDPKGRGLRVVRQDREVKP